MLVKTCTYSGDIPRFKSREHKSLCCSTYTTILHSLTLRAHSTLGNSSVTAMSKQGKQRVTIGPCLPNVLMVLTNQQSLHRMGGAYFGQDLITPKRLSPIQ